MVGDCQTIQRFLQRHLTKQRLAQSQAATTTAVRCSIPGMGTGGLAARLGVLIAGTWNTLVPTCIRTTIAATSASTSGVSARSSRSILALSDLHRSKRRRVPAAPAAPMEARPSKR